MKRIICTIAIIAGLSFAQRASAQEETVKHMTHKRRHTISVSKAGITITANDSTGSVVVDEGAADEDKETKPRLRSHIFMMDLGINLLHDNSNYSDPAVKNYLNVPANYQNKSLFDLRASKSVNVNIYPWLIRFRALRTHNQRIYITTGFGFQFYNFRYESALTYTKAPPGVFLDNIAMKKDKLAIDYLNVPLMFTFKSRMHGHHWLAYGVGLTEGVRIASWTKQKSDTRGKVKMHDSYGLADFNSCISAEIGIDGAFRFYTTYQLTSLFQNGLDQHPISFGIRFFGI
jgi:hypothetical protein